jgi:XTP/dITP diphosphohydrolase
MVLYVATSNAGKLAEFAASASSAGVEVRALQGLATMPEPVEDAPTFLGNAELKALAYSDVSGLPVLADDSGLEAAALQGAPGVFSARYAELAGYALDSGLSKDQRNNALLLERLQHHSDRSARFFCALAVADKGQILYRSSGICEGEVLAAPRGAGGFGYDPLFLLPKLGLTMAELSRERKWQISHRGNAFRNLLKHL